MQFDKPGRIFEAEQIAATLQKVGDEIIAEFREKTEDLLLLGIQRRGVPLANRLSRYIKEKLGVEIPVGTLDISMYRDDIGMRRTLPVIHETNIPDINGKTVILCDDVLQAGRTIRAAMDAITSFGRAREIQLAVLVDRGHRELPIRADYIGKNIPSALNESIQVKVAALDHENAVYICRP